MLLPPTENFTLLFLVAQLVRICLECRRPQFDSWVRKIHWRRDRLPAPVFLGFLGGSDGKESAYNVGDLGSIPGLERSPREGKGCPLQYSGLENSMDYTVHGVAKSRTQLSNFHFHFLFSNSVHIRSDQISRSVVSDSLRPHESQHARPPCPSPTPGVHLDSRPLSQ